MQFVKLHLRFERSKLDIFGELKYRGLLAVGGIEHSPLSRIHIGYGEQPDRCPVLAIAGITPLLVAASLA